MMIKEEPLEFQEEEDDDSNEENEPRFAGNESAEEEDEEEEDDENSAGSQVDGLENAVGEAGEEEEEEEVIIADSYLLGDQISSGTSTEVYKATNIKTNLPVAVKLVRIFMKVIELGLHIFLILLRKILSTFN
jgi:cobalamin biosynthesis protein CobT